MSTTTVNGNGTRRVNDRYNVREFSAGNIGFTELLMRMGVRAVDLNSIYGRYVPTYFSRPTRHAPDFKAGQLRIANIGLPEDITQRLFNTGVTDLDEELLLSHILDGHEVQSDILRRHLSRLSFEEIGAFLCQANEPHPQPILRNGVYSLQDARYVDVAVEVLAGRGALLDSSYAARNRFFRALRMPRESRSASRVETDLAEQLVNAFVSHCTSVSQAQDITREVNTHIGGGYNVASRAIHLAMLARASENGESISSECRQSAASIFIGLQSATARFSLTDGREYARSLHALAADVAQIPPVVRQHLHSVNALHHELQLICGIEQGVGISADHVRELTRLSERHILRNAHQFQMIMEDAVEMLHDRLRESAETNWMILSQGESPLLNTIAQDENLMTALAPLVHQTFIDASRNGRHVLPAEWETFFAARDVYSVPLLLEGYTSKTFMSELAHKSGPVAYAMVVAEQTQLITAERVVGEIPGSNYLDRVLSNEDLSVLVGRMNTVATVVAGLGRHTDLTVNDIIKRNERAQDWAEIITNPRHYRSELQRRTADLATIAGISSPGPTPISR